MGDINPAGVAPAAAVLVYNESGSISRRVIVGLIAQWAVAPAGVSVGYEVDRWLTDTTIFAKAQYGWGWSFIHMESHGCRFLAILVVDG